MGYIAVAIIGVPLFLSGIGFLITGLVLEKRERESAVKAAHPEKPIS